MWQAVTALINLALNYVWYWFSEAGHQCIMIKAQFSEAHSICLVHWGPPLYTDACPKKSNEKNQCLIHVKFGHMKFLIFLMGGDDDITQAYAPWALSPNVLSPKHTEGVCGLWSAIYWSVSPLPVGLIAALWMAAAPLFSTGFTNAPNTACPNTYYRFIYKYSNVPSIKFVACSDLCKHSQKFKESHVQEPTVTWILAERLGCAFATTVWQSVTFQHHRTTKDIIDSISYYLNRSGQQLPLRNDQCMSGYVCSREVIHHKKWCLQLDHYLPTYLPLQVVQFSPHSACDPRLSILLMCSMSVEMVAYCSISKSHAVQFLAVGTCSTLLPLHQNRITTFLTWKTPLIKPTTSIPSPIYKTSSSAAASAFPYMEPIMHHLWGMWPIGVVLNLWVYFFWNSKGSLLVWGSCDMVCL